MYVKNQFQQDLGFVEVIGGAFSGVLNLYNQTQRAQGEKEAYKQFLAMQAAQQQAQSQTPPWLLPVVIGGGVIVLALVLTKK